MTDKPPSDAAFAELREKFIANTRRRLGDVERLLDALAADHRDVAALDDMMRKLHGLAGLGTTFGFAQLTDVARQLEEQCREALGRGGLSQADLAHSRETMAELRRLLESGAHAVEPAEAAAAPAAVLDVVLLEDDPVGHLVAVRVLEKQGYTVRRAYDKANALRLLDERVPQALISDILVPDGTGYEVVEHLRTLPGGDVPPAIITSGLSGFVDKVEAIRAGADAFFEKPLDWMAVVQTLESLLERARESAPHVLYVQSDETEAEMVESILSTAGYVVRVTADPKHLDTDLAGFRPDLVIVDSKLPGVSGCDVARYLRQRQGSATIPVVIHGGDDSLEEKIDCMRAGANDHLPAPVDPRLLLAVVEARIERARYLRGLIEHDGLTGLLTHSAFMRRLKIRFDERGRVDRPPILVIGDLDHFKYVNDTYGHPIGDRVLTSLGTLLRKRLRRSDVIARYGGEEFALLLDDLTLDDAQRLTDRAREEFGQLEQSDDAGATFHVTFSAGIAPLHAGLSTAEQWKLAADQALYTAKHEGRNRVVAAPAG